jgi:hypothetical protein
MDESTELMCKHIDREYRSGPRDVTEFTYSEVHLIKLRGVDLFAKR